MTELGWNDRRIEAQLSHADRNKVRGAYHHAKYLPPRRAMMQAWADYLDFEASHIERIIGAKFGRDSGV